MNFSIILLLCMFISPPYGTAFGNTGMALLRQSSKAFESSEDDLSGQYNEAFQNSKKTLFGLHNTSLENSEETFLGKYICTAGTSLGLTLYGDDMSGFSLELKSDGQAIIEINGIVDTATWLRDGSTITLNIDGTDAVGEIAEDTITFKEFLKEQIGSSVDLTFAKEGTAATKPENYLLEEEKALIGDWKSVSVTNVLGYDISNEIDPTALKATFNYDHSATINFMGEEIGSSQWDMFTEMIIFNDNFGNDISVSGDYENGELTINYSNDDFYYVFTMSKQ